MTYHRLSGQRPPCRFSSIVRRQHRTHHQSIACGQPDIENCIALGFHGVRVESADVRELANTTSMSETCRVSIQRQGRHGIRGRSFKQASLDRAVHRHVKGAPLVNKPPERGRSPRNRRWDHGILSCFANGLHLFVKARARNVCCIEDSFRWNPAVQLVCGLSEPSGNSR